MTKDVSIVQLIRMTLRIFLVSSGYIQRVDTLRGPSVKSIITT